jgi:type IV secretory pathway TraG/TraD family ATPase VirD4
MREVMDSGKVLLVNLSKGKIGEDTSMLLGSLIVTKIEQGALSRADIPEEKRRDFYLYIDEFHSFSTNSFADMLSTLRKFRVCLVAVQQYLEQVDEKTIASIFGNAGTIITFRVGARDAEYLAKEFYPDFSIEDFVNLPAYHVYLRLMIDGVVSNPFSAVTLPSPDKTSFV